MPCLQHKPLVLILLVSSVLLFFFFLNLTLIIAEEQSLLQGVWCYFLPVEILPYAAELCSVVLTYLALSRYRLCLQLHPTTCSSLVFLYFLLSLSHSVCIFHTTLALFLLTIRAMANCIYKGFLNCGKYFSECAVLHHLALKGRCFPDLLLFFSQWL